jgi:hypothetical protein
VRDHRGALPWRQAPTHAATAIACSCSRNRPLRHLPAERPCDFRAD